MLEKEAAALGREILEAVAPDDVEDFDAVVKYQAGAAPASQSGVGLSLGIGLEAGVLLGLLWPVLKEALLDLATRLAKQGVVEADSAVRDWLARRKTQASLTQAQASEVVVATVSFCRAKGLDAEACTALEAILNSRIPVRG